MFRDGTLTLKGTTADDVVFDKPEDMSVRIYHDPPTNPLTTGQLVRPHCVGMGTPVTQLLPSHAFSGTAFQYSEIPCVDPYGVPPDACEMVGEASVRRSVRF